MMYLLIFLFASLSLNMNTLDANQQDTLSITIDEAIEIGLVNSYL